MECLNSNISFSFPYIIKIYCILIGGLLSKQVSTYQDKLIVVRSWAKNLHSR